jgi:lysozyme
MYFNKYHHKNLKNEKEAARIDKIITEYNDKTFGFDISHYQKKKI